MLENSVRFGAVVLFCAILFLYLILVVFKLQVLKHEEYSKQRDYQNSFSRNENKRGTIFGRLKNGEMVPIAEDHLWYKLVLIPKNVNESYEERLYTEINKITEIDRNNFHEKLANKSDPYELIKVISKDEAEKIESLGLDGVYTYKTFKRIYPLGDVGGRILGFVGGGEDGFSGRYGLEKYYESDLSPKNVESQTFFSSIFDTNVEENIDKSTKEIVTTLEPNVMKFLNRTLLEMKNTWEADEVSAIVMNPETGEIIAMETVPGYDPNNFAEADIKNFGNPSVQGVYELGSIMKPITMAGGIDLNLVKPSTIFHDYGFIKVDDYIIKNFDEKVRGDVSMQDVISQSLNTGAVYVQKLMGKDNFREYFKKFGLTESSQIDFPGEVTNKTSNLETNTEVNFATAAFGQGVAVTPVTMITALSVLVNDGKNTCAHFLYEKKLSDGIGASFVCEKEIIQVVSTTTSETVKNMMIELIDTGLANGRYKDKNYKVGAKTGTAQLPSPDGKYYKDKFVHSYFTFFPGENPKFAVLIYQVNPKKGQLASLTLAPSASKIKDFLLTYYNIPPDR